MGIKVIVTHYPLRMLDGKVRLFKRTQVFPSNTIEELLYEFDNYEAAIEKAKDLQDKYDLDNVRREQ